MFFSKSWIRQPTTIMGLGALAAGGVLYATGAISVAEFGAVIAFALVHLGITDNSQAAADAQTLAVDTIKGVASHQLEIVLPQIMRDATAFMGDLKPKPPAPVVNAGSIVSAGSVTVGLVLAIGLGASLVACTDPAQQAQLQAACKTDQGIVPIADATIAALAPELAGPVAIDQVLVHPAVVKLCAGLGGTPTTAPLTAPLASTPATTPPAATLPASTAAAAGQ